LSFLYRSRLSLSDSQYSGSHSHCYKTIQKVIILLVNNSRKKLQQSDVWKHEFEALVSLSDELIPQFIQAMDGEKDPRNLLVAFKIFKLMMRVLDISKYIEDLFELLWCYFPITFKPPPNDPYAITSEELKQHLRECIAATPYFAKFAMPSLQEKLENTSDIVKVV
jgi:hypothetical protein